MWEKKFKKTMKITCFEKLGKTGANIKKNRGELQIYGFGKFAFKSREGLHMFAYVSIYSTCMCVPELIFTI